MKIKIVLSFGLLLLVLIATSCDLNAFEAITPNHANNQDSHIETETTTSIDVQMPDHYHLYELMVISPPSCGVEGKQAYVCAICGELQHETSIAALPHNYQHSDILSTRQTCTTDGKEVYYCISCGCTQEEVLKATGHKWYTEAKCDSNTNEIVIEPYCTVCHSVSAYDFRYKINDVGKLVRVPSTGHLFGDLDYIIVGGTQMSKAPYYGVYCNDGYLLIVRSTQKVVVDDFSVGSLMSDPLRFYTSRGCTVVFEVNISITTDGRIQIVQYNR